MVDLKEKKVGIVACSGEEIPEGTITRLAALKVLEDLRPGETVTICLPLFLAGGEGDRAFARFYPTIAVDGCELRCAARGTEMYSGKPAGSVVVSELLAERGMARSQSARKLDQAGLQAANMVADEIANLVDDLIKKRWSRRKGEFLDNQEVQMIQETPQAAQATCACGSGIPVQEVNVNGEIVTLVALPLIFQQQHSAGRTVHDLNSDDLLDIVRIYNPIPAGQESFYAEMLKQEYARFCEQMEVTQ